MTKFKNKKSLKALSLKTCKLFKIKCCCKTVDVLSETEAAEIQEIVQNASSIKEVIIEVKN